MATRLGTYLEQQIQSAEPLNLICISYRTAIQAVRDARTALARNDIPERVEQINLAYGIVAELYRALDFKAGDGKLAAELGRLYEFIMRNLLEANAHRSDKPLGHALDLLVTLAESWEKISAQGQPCVSAPAVPVSTPKSWEVAEPAAEPVHYSFSF